MSDVMTNEQFDKILAMVTMIMDGCKDLDEAKKKVNDLITSKDLKQNNK